MLREISEEKQITRYTFGDRVIHWWNAITFIYLMLSGLALGYPRMAWLQDILGGGQTVRAVHPWVGIGFTLGIVVMAVAWLRDMLFVPEDREFTRQLPKYAREGHLELDLDKFNAGQKGYFWFAIISGVLLLLTGLPLWLPGMLDSGWNQIARLSHHLLFLFTIGGFIIHVYMSTAMLPGTMRSMTTGKVERRWAAFHHSRWFRRQEARGL